MTETGKSEETADLPLEGSPGRKTPESMDTDDAQSADQGRAKSGPPSALELLRTPTSSRKSDADVFKTPDPVTPTTSAKKRKRLTPEDKALREKERQEKRRKLEEEKQKKENERLEKLKQKEAERLKKEEERKRSEEEKRVERLKKEEERLKKEEERKKIEEEKKQEKLKKEEERLKKEEERKKKDDEKRQKEEEKERERLKIEEKKAKQAQFFTKFFQKSSAPKVQTIENGSVRSHEKNAGDTIGADSAAKNSALFNPLPFQIKTDMAVAPLCRRKLGGEERKALESLFLESTCVAGAFSKTEYLKSIKNGKARKDTKTEVPKESPEIQILREENSSSKPVGCCKWRMKLLQFHENRRPAYWGTWKRKARKVTARRPLTRENEVDYDFDSDDEWEDEPDDAEEIGDSGEEADDQEEGGDGDEDEEGWMVPHGYLSDSEREGKNEDLESLKCKEKEFYKSLKEKTMIGYPFIITDNLSCYKIRICPVFRSANVVKKRKPRAPKKKPEAAKPAVLALPPPQAPKPAVPGPPPETSKPVADPENKPTEQRKTQRKRKLVEAKPNPYAKPPSGFLGMELPSDDEEDKDWGSSMEESCSSASGENETDDDDGSDSDDDLFIPVSKSKK